MDTKNYIIKSFDKEFYCKITNIYNNYTLSVGGKNNYCLIVAIKQLTPTQAYIDSIEFNEKCVKDGTLEENNGMFKLVTAGLYTLKIKFPKVEKILLKDDSYVYCKKGSKEYKLSLAHDYIIKYNETWYQKQFNATLPKEYLETFNKSLKVLDEPLDNYEFQVSLIPQLKEYEDIYMKSKTPREFIKSLKHNLKEEYCFKVGKWLNHYMDKLNIKLFSDFWYIDTTNISIPEKYSIEETKDILKGGSRNTRKKVNFSIVSGGDRSSIIGVYE